MGARTHLIYDDRSHWTRCGVTVRANGAKVSTNINAITCKRCRASILASWAEADKFAVVRRTKP